MLTDESLAPLRAKLTPEQQRDLDAMTPEERNELTENLDTFGEEWTARHYDLIRMQMSTVY